MKKALFALALLLIFFLPLTISYHAMTAKQNAAAENGAASSAPYDYSTASTVLSEATGRIIPAQFLESLPTEEIDGMLSQVESGSGIIKGANGESINVMLSRFGNEIDGKTVIDLGSNGKNYFELGFTGDMNFTEEGYIMPHARELANGVVDCIDSAFKNVMKSVDIMLVNNEFTYSERGTPMANKQYTFRADPDSVKYLTLLGVDIVSLANNHTYDYGHDAFIDTLGTLDNAGIARVGAGENLNEASKEISYIINGCKVAYLAASRAESIRFTPVATKDSEGVFGCYEGSEELINRVAEAKAKNDYVIVYVHWGAEYSTELTDPQKELAKKYIDAGADAVIGAHPHILQGMEIYNGKPVVYSLGNFLFGTKTLDSGLAVLRIENGSISLKFMPGRQENSEVKYLGLNSERERIFSKIIDISPSKIKIDSEGNVTAG
ncbi:MAG: CapA family protein [Clostridia bacterium]|nr:CapA family protein [Clostridia bacterium]